jgi:peptidoglycan hydrolase-like protein with peptidoglycan-binding domain
MRFVFMFVLCSSLFGCGHTRVAADAPATPAGAEAAPKPVTSSGPPAKSKRDARNEDDDDKTGKPLFASPADELSPDGLAKLQAKLVAVGVLAADDATGHFDAKTERAVRTFQRSRHLPATGAPDDATVGALGFKSEDVFRRGTQ